MKTMKNLRFGINGEIVYSRIISRKVTLGYMIQWTIKNLDVYMKR